MCYYLCILLWLTDPLLWGGRNSCMIVSPHNMHISAVGLGEGGNH